MNRYNQAPHLIQDTNAKVTTSQLYNTNESQDVSPFPTGDHKASINIHARKHKKQDSNKPHSEHQPNGLRESSQSKANYR